MPPVAQAADTSTATTTTAGRAPVADALAGGGEDVQVLTSRGVRERRRADSIRTHDFRQSGFLAASELRRIRLRHEQFVRALAARLAIFLRVEVTVQLSKLQIVGYQNFIGSLPGPTHITLFRVDPLKGTGLLVIPPRLGLSLVDRLLGGPGRMTDATRDLSEIETALIDQVALLLVGEWCTQWPEMRDLRPSLAGHESNSRFLQTATPDAAMLVLTLDAGLGELVGELPAEGVNLEEVEKSLVVQALERAGGEAARKLALRAASQAPDWCGPQPCHRETNEEHDSRFIAHAATRTYNDDCFIDSLARSRAARVGPMLVQRNPWRRRDCAGNGGQSSEGVSALRSVFQRERGHTRGLAGKGVNGSRRPPRAFTRQGSQVRTLYHPPELKGFGDSVH